MELYEKTLSRKDIYFGKVVSLHVDDVQTPDGKVSVREIVEHPGGVCVAAIDSESCLYFVEQFRYAYGEVVLELPAGKLDPNENPDAAAERELREETGLSAEKIQKLSVFYPSPGCYAERLHLYLATGLVQGESHLDDDEFLNVKRIPLKAAVDMALSGELRDGKTVALVLMADKLLNG